MNELVACCGLDCGRCEARLATINNDDALRERVARQWAEWNNAPYIKAEHINCMGCRTQGCKTYYCSDLCKIRHCTLHKGHDTCADCLQAWDCAVLAEVLKNAPEACANLMHTHRILLRHWRDEDAHALYLHAADPEVGRRAGWAPHRSVQESLHVIRHEFATPTTWAIVLKATGEPIGAIGYGPACYGPMPARTDEPVVGYWVARPYWNQGICTEALQLVLHHVERHTDIPSLFSAHFVDNPASGHVMEKCGFVPTGQEFVAPSFYAGADRPIRALRYMCCCTGADQ